MTALGQLFGQHVPRNRYDDEGAPVGTYCVCGGWESDYSADGEAGPFDEHLAVVVLAWVVAEGWKAPEAAVEVPVSDLEPLDVQPDACDSHQGRCPTPRQLRQADMAKAWSEGHTAGRDYQGDGWSSDAHDPNEDNPYRPGAKR